MNFGQQCFRNSGRRFSGPCALPVLIRLIAEDSSLMGKGAERKLSTLGAFLLHKEGMGFACLFELFIKQ